MIHSGDIHLVELGEPAGSEAGFTRPVAVVTAQLVLDHGPRVVHVVPLTSTLYFADDSESAHTLKACLDIHRLPEARMYQARVAHYHGVRHQGVGMPVRVNKMTPDEALALRDSLLRKTRMSRAELEAAVKADKVTWEQRSLWERICDIEWLIGDDSDSA